MTSTTISRYIYLYPSEVVVHLQLLHRAMASMAHYSLAAGISFRKTLTSKLSAVQTSNMANSRHLSNLVVTNNVHSPIPKFTFPQLSLATKRQLSVAAKNKEDRWKLRCGGNAPGCTSDTDILIRRFFCAINTSDEQLLEDVLSYDCELKDFIFQIAFDGEQSIIQFLRKVMKAMGDTIRFEIDNVQGEDGLDAATASLHLEWQNQEIPFTRFCTHFQFEDYGEKLLIRCNNLIAILYFFYSMF
ncbi:NTF2-LIKE DOMAIN-CONTAINING PROTEIN-RELATED [Salix purpurea]|uniref:NTF2-LIKE DOMAIN-CONTAINING PROTEIN-RELATED n=1 Tax=Salix purpurea TaxID=77065 RepID=A0A9Q0SQ54_SALPP|nr:NTF2-LIKE DOMAIN-CONTAINING PROTEIN-RELATED [Salix purpurea]